MKQEVRNVGKLSLPTGYYRTISISIMRLINSELLRQFIMIQDNIFIKTIFLQTRIDLV